MEKQIEAVEKMVRRDHLLKAAMGFVSLLGGTLLLYLHQQSEVFNVFMFSGAMILSICGAILLPYGIYHFLHVRNSTLIKVLKQDPDDVVWIYHYIMIQKPWGVQIRKSCLLYFHLLNGDHFTISIPAKKAENLMDDLKPHLPLTTFGHSVEKEQLYKADPLLLRRSGSIEN